MQWCFNALTTTTQTITTTKIIRATTRQIEATKTTIMLIILYIININPSFKAQLYRMINQSVLKSRNADTLLVLIKYLKATERFPHDLRRA